jgi:hypothetical protein
LTWDEADNADYYVLERRDYDLDAESWDWVEIATPAAGSGYYLDISPRYCGTNNPIDYRIRGANSYGYSPSWATDTGYPKMRPVGITFWCAADNSSGTNAVVPWSRAVADFDDANSFWNDYGYDFVMENSGQFFWMTNTAYRNITGTEDVQMHAQFGQQTPHYDYINVYYVATVDGNPTAAYDIAYCPGTNHNTWSTFIVMGQEARTGCPGTDEIDIILAHELGHGLARFWDIYLLDLNGNGVMDDGTNCSINTWCNGQFPFGTNDVPPMFCDEDAAYPEEPGAYYKTPKNLMWYSFCGAPVSQYDLTVDQYIYASERLQGMENGYPIP